MKLQSSKKEILSLATNGKVYQAALSLVAQDRVKAIHYTESDRILRAWVIDLNGEKHKVSILLRSNGSYQKSVCSCADSKNFFGNCAHQTALLLQALGLELKDFAGLKANKVRMQEIEDSLKRSKKSVLENRAVDQDDIVLANAVKALMATGLSVEEAEQAVRDRLGLSDDFIFSKDIDTQKSLRPRITSLRDAKKNVIINQQETATKNSSENKKNFSEEIKTEEKKKQKEKKKNLAFMMPFYKKN